MLKESYAKNGVEYLLPSYSGAFLAGSMTVKSEGVLVSPIDRYQLKCHR